MAAEGGALVSHEVIENPTEKRQKKKKPIVKLQKKVQTKTTAFLGFAIKTFV